ncbi:MAG TPA: DUF488 domain-containing protein [Xanthomonadaceae bacterium]|nr:DUF488 domain-containing protein [Xanthomonadaceae bacterium]
MSEPSAPLTVAGLPPTLWTVGHSTKAWEEFVALLHSAQIQVLADVRRFAASRRHPQFAGAQLSSALREAQIDYLPIPELGGRRSPRRDSPNTAWRVAGFRGYADYMQTDAYQSASARLASRARSHRTAVMCAESLWWQCHRGLIADDFKVRGWTVLHLLKPGQPESHPYTRAARIVDGRLDYSLPVSDSQPALF